MLVRSRLRTTAAWGPRAYHSRTLALIFGAHLGVDENTGKPSSVRIRGRWWIVCASVLGLIVGNGPIMQFTFGVLLPPPEPVGVSATRRIDVSIGVRRQA